MTTFAQRLHHAILSTRTPALVGLDPRFDQLPEPIVRRARSLPGDRFSQHAAAFEEFSKRIIDVIAGRVPAVKPQVAFFEECGPPGLVALQNVILHARNHGLIVIADAKRGDIGSTAEAYARAWLAGEDPAAAPFAADALTVNPYLGSDTLEPFVKLVHERAAGLYVLVRTSNPGAGIFQDWNHAGEPLFHHVATEVERLALQTAAGGDYGSVGAVVGATWPQELAQLRALMPHVPLLVPGYGSQGGNSTDVAAGFDQRGLGALINSSRGIIFAHKLPQYAQAFSPDRWEDAVAAATSAMIDDLAAHTSASTLRSS